ncbi:acyltransferase [Actinomycetospora endophytica]|uniref:Acyltransferase n=1 Tax=Actinomycetospora endophytica TaxID=2291215 RepID=A0ABS8PBZ2_9PSEU|nr:acyltransferase [Actinomycetospora endophytica]MCD2195508.1 acyltransferase [Actinomycetospora endophytica]
MRPTVEVATTTAGPAPASDRRHLHEVDLFRLLTFASVIGVHVLSAATTADDVPSNGGQLLLHFTREAFFTLTGFVLTFQMLRRPQRPLPFWRKRIPLVLTPYLTWTVVYSLLAVWTRAPGTAEPTVSQELATMGWNALEGTAWYHLYFLLVTLQLYLVFPVLVAGLRRLGRTGHLVVLGVALALQIAVCVLISNPPANGFGAFVTAHGFALLPSYLLYPVLGAVAALHLDQVQAAVLRFRWWIAGLVVVAVVASEVVYVLRVDGGTAAVVASAVFEPTTIAWFLVAVLGLYTFSLVATAGWRPGGPARRVLAYASDRSFGIFLAHPLVLAGLLTISGGWVDAVGSGLTLAALYLGTVVGSVVIADVLRRVPGSTALTGRVRIGASGS